MLLLLLIAVLVVIGVAVAAIMNVSSDYNKFRERNITKKKKKKINLPAVESADPRSRLFLRSKEIEDFS